MCGRYTLKTPVSELQKQFELTAAPPELKERFNIAPTQEVPVVLNTGPRQLELVRWGLIPFWAKDAKIGNKMINARGETLAEKPAYRDALRRKRCLVLVDGFYEWKEGPLGKTPLHIRKKSGQPFAFAGLWDSWRDPSGATLRSCTIVTTRANALMSRFHDRMPVILEPGARELWLRPEALEPSSLLELVRPYAGDDLEAFEVSRLVNSPKNDLPECVLPAA
jgi:putative SOS response-associated peptidase YedK